MASKDKWYNQGLKFSCKGCGKCCGGAPGYVWIDNTEITTISKHLKIEEKDFIKKYTRRIVYRISLKEQDNYDCIFLRDNKCMIYPVRPIQCQSYPWWDCNLKSQQSWDDAARTCKGMRDKKGKLYSKEEIQKIIQYYKSKKQ